MRKLLPAMRVSLGLIMAVVSIILLSDLLGLIPDRTTAVIDGRKKIAETLAIQYSLAARRNDYDSIESSMKMLVEHNDEVLSAALRNAGGIVLAEVGDHTEHWDVDLGEKSTPTQMQVPIYKNATLRQKWGSVELRFTPTSKVNFFGFTISPLAVITGFVAITGFMVFLLLIKRVFNNIDPSSVVPSRVRKALDTLTEGVLLMDKKSTILLVNDVFVDTVGVEESQIVGKKVVDLGWQENCAELPWVKTLKAGISAVGEKIELALPDRSNILFIVNSSAVLDDSGKQQGVMVTFDNVTELEARNGELCEMVNRLKVSSEQINRQNEELRNLATRDPLTNCLNRRILFDKFEEKCLDAIKNNAEFSCMMLDIDHFKRVNDNYGHAAGDEVLRVVAGSLKAVLRGDDEVFRYGGEEFCVLLPGTDMESAARLAERVRVQVEAQVVADAAAAEVIRVTASIGTSSIKSGAENLPALIEKADAALYKSKRNGRNRVTGWTPEIMRSEQAADGHQLNVEAMLATATETVSLTAGHQDIDEVTGLPNRAYFRRELARMLVNAQQQEQLVAVIMLVLNMFQRINSVFGYTTGDAVLKSVAKRLIGTLRATDPACRIGNSILEQVVYGLGGDEFGFLLTGLGSQDDVSIVIERLIESLAVPVIVNDQQIYLTCSIGASMFPGDGADADNLITCAGVALQQAKRDGKHSSRFFSNEFVSVVRNDYEIEKSLRYALDSNEFELYFQPQLDIQTMRIESVEALIRWNHPQRGIIMPDEFIPAAERSGQIVAIGQWVIKTACQQIRGWLDSGYELSVAVNLSPVQFLQKNLVEHINAAISSTGINPQLLQLEITESMIMEHLDSVLETMQILARLGHKISIDDFGTGYSSLEYLKRFPIDNLKIDRTFVKDVSTDPDDAAIVRAAISMAHGMGLQVVAEGVETEEQLLFLRNLRCDMVQGYLLGMPLPAKDVITLINEKQWQWQAQAQAS